MRVAPVVCVVLILLSLPRGVGAAPDLLPAGKTFTSAMWGLAFDYPDDWSLDDDGEEVRFRSADGEHDRARPDRDRPAIGARAWAPCGEAAVHDRDQRARRCLDRVR